MTRGTRLLPFRLLAFGPAATRQPTTALWRSRVTLTPATRVSFPGSGLGSGLNIYNRRLESTTATTSALSSSTPKSDDAAGEVDYGHIVPGPNEAILYLDNIFPLGLSAILWRRWGTDKDFSEQLLKRFEKSSFGITDPISMVKRSIPKSLPIKVTEIIPRLKDGGAFVKFSHGPETTPAEIEESLAKSLQDRPVKPWFNPFTSVRVNAVKGVPWLEDLYRLPRARLKVEFCPPRELSKDATSTELSQEALYGLFRRYGKLSEITPQPSDSKVTPRFAHVDFVRVRDAVVARNCLHGLTISKDNSATRLRLSYEQRVKPHKIWEWTTSHPRIVIPILAALLAAFTVVVFDPIREFFVRAHVQGSFRVSNSRLYRWFKRRTADVTNSVFQRRHDKGEQAGLQALWSQRKDIIDSVQKWLLETADTFIVVQGPRGSGTKELIIDQALKGRPNVLVIDCKPIVEARGESGTIRKLAVAVGYRPVFSWANSLSSMIDLAVQGTTGVKSGFSETLESQIVKILHTTASALKKVSLEQYKKDGSGAEMSEDAYLEAHPEKRAVIVIDNFLHKHDDGGLVYDKIAEWAAAMVQSNIAHVVFLTNDSSYSKSLSKSLPDRIFRQVSLGDLSPSVAKKYVLGHLEGLDRDESLKDDNSENSEDDKGAEKPSEHDIEVESKRRRDLAELDGCIDTLGGRLTDLEFLARRLKSGQSPRNAISEIVDQSSSEIIKMFLLAKKSLEGTQTQWSPEQAWFLIKEIASKTSLRYNEVLLSPTFASSTTPSAADGEAAIEALAAAELVTVTSHRGRPQTIRAGRPVYQAAFTQLTQDAVLKARMNLLLLTELSKVEAKNIDKVETELALLGALPKQPREITDRVTYLLGKLHSSQVKVAELDREMAALKGVLVREV
ncbi:mitochondrial escape protein 2 [Pyricularia grisea]|uniref:Mitochondrial escape protein 2 n=1 Tax=Pyricularia grisea TaxID=148305 RepID=A0A6P8B7H7_PYRGI|nr:hypothetical protein PgNI_06050 [Pyricularia grisea]KAI6360275.1 mitochondrial escape protein 2 [Pyricularia grisea]TLD11084.1 hypothetical protein PgNI_06050 [Pyricularia grisea]